MTTMQALHREDHREAEMVNAVWHVFQLGDRTDDSVTVALAEFAEVTGREATHATLNPRNNHLSIDEVRYSGGCSLSECWLASGEPEPEPRGRFSIRRDLALEAGCTHFWCHGHLQAVPLDDQSGDPCYCQECYEVVTAERDVPGHLGSWSADGASYVIGDVAYRVTPCGETVGIRQGVVQGTVCDGKGTATRFLARPKTPVVLGDVARRKAILGQPSQCVSGASQRKSVGRPVRVADEDAIRRLSAEGLSTRQIAGRTGVPRSTIHRLLKGKR